MKKHCQPGLRLAAIKTIGQIVLWFVLCQSITTCGGSPEIGEGIGFPISATGTFAYVEGVDFPDEIRAGDILEFEVRVSMATNTHLLYGTRATGISAGGGYVFDQDNQIIGMTIDSSVDGPFTGTEPRYLYTMSTLPFPEGEHTLFIISADSRESGGLQTKVDITPFFIIHPHPNLIVREFPFTVLPAEDETGAGE